MTNEIVEGVGELIKETINRFFRQSGIKYEYKNIENYNRVVLIEEDSEDLLDEYIAKGICQ